MPRNFTPDDSPGAPHRQWNEILQEIRVMQTGIQILAAFLVILPFQARFTMLTGLEEIFYVILLVFSAVLIILMLMPVLVHRYLFGQRLKATTVLLGHRVVKLVGICAGLLVACSVWFVVQVLMGGPVSIFIGGGLVAVTLFLLVLLPRILTPRGTMPESYDEG
ncbi:DUF6328 family protein [Glutamicibacter protophormiae]|uniref:DUF6328 family protein n=1 Tax=Glutamicibacter protophormiae TaxID=37930 RepID=UPI00195BA9A3|nr:DUF6328 family protein [Glutamicibacter protophormiae]QRQ78015.1 hypothetical protein JQN66_14000 [Glutamicibacter protophormiae]